MKTTNNRKSCKQSLDDPDMGLWSYAYDALSNLTHQTDARGQRICLYYDPLNRLLGKHYRADDNCPTSPTYNVSYGYDAGTYGKLQRTSMTDASGTPSATFVYDGDGNRVKTTVGTITTAYIGNHTEWNVSTQEMTRYYLAGGQRIAFRVIKSGQADKIFYLLADHLGSTNVVMQVGGVVENKTYTAWGKDRTGSITKTDRQYTGQINESELGLYFYNARYYDPDLGRFISADTIVPQPGNPQDWDRYGYIRNNPVNYTDPSGHKACSDWDNDGTCIVDTEWQEGKSGETASSPNPSTITEKALNGDFNALMKLITPTHIGWRVEGFICFLLGCTGIGGNIIYNFEDEKLVMNFDVLGGAGLGPQKMMPRLGGLVSTGPLIGWASTHIEDSTSGWSGQFNAFAAAKYGLNISVSVPKNDSAKLFQGGGKDISDILHVDSTYGQVPVTLYISGGAGLGAGMGVSLVQVKKRQEIYLLRK